MLQEYKVIDKKHDSVAIFIDDIERATMEFEKGNIVYVRSTYSTSGEQIWKPFNPEKDTRSIAEKNLDMMNKHYHKTTPTSYKNRQKNSLIKYHIYKKIKNDLRFDDKPNITQIGKNHGVMWKTVNDVRNDHKKYSEYFEKYNSEIKAFSQMYCDKKQEGK